MQTEIEFFNNCSNARNFDNILFILAEAKDFLPIYEVAGQYKKKTGNTLDGFIHAWKFIVHYGYGIEENEANKEKNYIQKLKITFKGLWTVHILKKQLIY